MKIGIIGVGEIGGTLTRHYQSAGHHVKIANTGKIENLKRIAKETGALPVPLKTLLWMLTSSSLVYLSLPCKT